MPTYEYACTSCHRHFEVQQSFSDAPLEICEVCGGTLKRVFHPVGIVLKGSGFYATDSRSKKSSTSAPSTKESSASGESTSTTETKPGKKADSKPDSKPESKP